MKTDFRIRMTGDRFFVWRRVGSGCERLADPHPSRSAAATWIRGVAR